MPNPTNQLPADVLHALQQNEMIEAIKLLRQSSGLGLKESKDVIDSYLRGESVTITRPAAAGVLSPEVTEALQRGNKIEAIKHLREQTGLGLKEAKDAIEAAQPVTRTTPQGGAPGEVLGAGRVIGWLLALALAGLVAYYTLHHSG